MSYSPREIVKGRWVIDYKQDKKWGSIALIDVNNTKTWRHRFININGTLITNDYPSYQFNSLSEFENHICDSLETIHLPEIKPDVDYYNTIIDPTPWQIQYTNIMGTLIIMLPFILYLLWYYR